MEIQIKSIVWKESCFQSGGFDGHCAKFYFHIFKNAFYPEIEPFEYRLIFPVYGQAPIFHDTLENLKTKAQLILNDLILETIEPQKKVAIK